MQGVYFPGQFTLQHGKSRKVVIVVFFWLVVAIAFSAFHLWPGKNGFATIEQRGEERKGTEQLGLMSWNRCKY